MNLQTFENAFQNIKTACQDRLEELYPKGIPEEIYSRYTKELSFLKDSSVIDDFEIFRRLSVESKKSGSIIDSRGTISGSILFFLLSNNSFNPLQPHYYCPRCGYYEKVDTFLFGIDLPQKECPCCKTNIFADGYNLPSESVWGNDGKKLISFEFNVNSEFLPFIRRVLESMYPNNRIVPWGTFNLVPDLNIPDAAIHNIKINLSGYAILPKNNTIQDYTDLISWLETGDPCISGNSHELEEHLIKPIRLYTLSFFDQLIQLQRKTGIYVDEINSKELRNISWSNMYNTGIMNQTTLTLFHEYKPKSYKDMVALESASHSTFSWQEKYCGNIDFYTFHKMISSESFSKYPCFSREDFFDHMIKMGVDRSLAFDASERIRKGHANSFGKLQEQFFNLPIPENIKEIAKNYYYLFPRAHCIEYVLIYARMAYYAKIDSRSFSKIVFHKK